MVADFGYPATALEAILNALPFMTLRYHWKCDRAENPTVPEGAGESGVDVQPGGGARADGLAADRVQAGESVARERGIGLSVDAPEPATAFLRSGGLAQLLDRLLAKALEAAPDGGRGRIESGCGLRALRGMVRRVTPPTSGVTRRWSAGRLLRSAG